jgi:hypothetical protein
LYSRFNQGAGTNDLFGLKVTLYSIREQSSFKNQAVPCRQQAIAMRKGSNRGEGLKEEGKKSERLNNHINSFQRKEKAATTKRI